MSDLPVSQALYDGIRTLILSARQTVARGVDLLQVHTNYEIGRRIVEQEQQGANGHSTERKMRELAARLSRPSSAKDSQEAISSTCDAFIWYIQMSRCT